MFRKILDWLKKPTLQNRLDAYIASKHPTSTAEVEYWVNHYLYRNTWNVL